MVTPKNKKIANCAQLLYNQEGSWQNAHTVNAQTVTDVSAGESQVVQKI